jgi:hypothetical protein
MRVTFAGAAALVVVALFIALGSRALLRLIDPIVSGEECDGRKTPRPHSFETGLGSATPPRRSSAQVERVRSKRWLALQQPARSGVPCQPETSDPKNLQSQDSPLLPNAVNESTVCTVELAAAYEDRKLGGSWVQAGQRSSACCVRRRCQLCVLRSIEGRPVQAPYFAKGSRGLQGPHCRRRLPWRYQLLKSFGVA